jgi:hypothetical protein
VIITATRGSRGLVGGGMTRAVRIVPITTSRAASVYVCCFTQSRSAGVSRQALMIPLWKSNVAIRFRASRHRKGP